MRSGPAVIAKSLDVPNQVQAADSQPALWPVVVLTLAGAVNVVWALFLVWGTYRLFDAII
jgi:hypothetical protein